MKAILKHIRLNNIKKHVDRSTAAKLGQYLLGLGFIKNGGLLTLNEHQFVFEGGGQKWIVSYRKLVIKKQILPKDRVLELQAA